MPEPDIIIIPGHSKWTKQNKRTYLWRPSTNRQWNTTTRSQNSL